MKKLVSLLIVGVLSIAVFAGCGGTPAANGTASPSGTAKPAETTGKADPNTGESVSITVWTNFLVEADLLQKYADLWAE